MRLFGKPGGSEILAPVGIFHRVSQFLVFMKGSIANFSGKMLRANADGAGITGYFDELLSTEVNGSYKPEAAAYEFGMKRLHLKKEEIIFAAFGGWDAYGAKTFGYTTYWVNRLNLPPEELGIQADHASNTMEGLLKFVLGTP